MIVLKIDRTKKIFENKEIQQNHFCKASSSLLLKIKTLYSSLAPLFI